MRRTVSWVGALGLGVMFAGACGDDADIMDTRPLGGRGGAAGSGAGGTPPGLGGGAGTGGNAAGSGGAAGAAGAPAAAADAGPDAAAGSGGDLDAGGGVVPDAGDAGPLISCGTAADCDDGNACTTQACVASFCQFTPVAAGAACGDPTAGECTAPDSCSAGGVCLANHEPDGSACSEGFCNLSGACDCAISRITSVPFSEQWITIGVSQGGSDTNVYDGICQECTNDLDHVVVFQAPAAGTYVFSGSSTGSASVWVVESDCTSLGAELGCEDDEESQVELTLEQGQIVTMGVSESCESLGGDGSLSITLAGG